MVLICFFYFLTGLGGCSAFSAAVKTCRSLLRILFSHFAYAGKAALNWPNHRGTATAFPLAAFGLSAFFFSTISGLAFPDDTSGYLLLLSIGTFCLVFISFFFLHVIHPASSYTALATNETDPSLPPRESNPLHRRKSSHSDDSRAELHAQPGKTISVCSYLVLLRDSCRG